MCNSSKIIAFAKIILNQQKTYVVYYDNNNFKVYEGARDFDSIINALIN